MFTAARATLSLEPSGLVLDFDELEGSEQ